MLQTISSVVLYFVQNWGYIKAHYQASDNKFRHTFRQIQVHVDFVKKSKCKYVSQVSNGEGLPP